MYVFFSLNRNENTVTEILCMLSSSLLLINITAGSYVCYPSNTSVGQWHAKQKVEDSPQLKPLCLL